MDWVKLGEKLLEISPYALLTAISCGLFYLMFKANVNSTNKQFDKSIDAIKQAYADAFDKIKKL